MIQIAKNVAIEGSPLQEAGYLPTPYTLPYGLVYEEMELRTRGRVVSSGELEVWPPTRNHDAVQLRITSGKFLNQFFMPMLKWGWYYTPTLSTQRLVDAYLNVGGHPHYTFLSTFSKKGSFTSFRAMGTNVHPWRSVPATQLTVVGYQYADLVNPVGSALAFNQDEKGDVLTLFASIANPQREPMTMAVWSRQGIERAYSANIYSCMANRPEYVRWYVENPAQIGILVGYASEEQLANKTLLFRALIWRTDGNEVCVDRVYPAHLYSREWWEVACLARAMGWHFRLNSTLGCSGFYHWSSDRWVMSDPMRLAVTLPWPTKRVFPYVDTFSSAYPVTLRGGTNGVVLLPQGGREAQESYNERELLLHAVQGGYEAGYRKWPNYKRSLPGYGAPLGFGPTLHEPFAGWQRNIVLPPWITGEEEIVVEKQGPIEYQVDLD